MDEPRDPVSAATHPDPYPYYARLVSDGGFCQDESSGLWIATSASAVRATLSSDHCRVRPSFEPVPANIRNSPAGAIFRRLVRMNDHGRHRSIRHAVVKALATLDTRTVALESSRFAHEITQAPEHHPPIARSLPVCVIGAELGISRDRLADVARSIGDFVLCLSPLSTPVMLERSNRAAVMLGELFQRILNDGTVRKKRSLVHVLQNEMRKAGCTDDDVVANAIGFLSQTYEATAGLIGNTLLALDANPAANKRIESRPRYLRQVIGEVLRHDPPIQNTRRFVDQDSAIAGERLRAGETILVVLAAANRDPALFSNPDRFDPARCGVEHFTFGTGNHACPGRDPATIVAAAAIERLVADGWAGDSIGSKPEYFPSVNARIPAIQGVTARGF